MAWELKWTIKKEPWMSDPSIRWNAGLKAAGIQWRQHLQRSHYPPQKPRGWVAKSQGITPSTYQRTYMLASKASFVIAQKGKTMQFGSTSYAKYPIFGTGVYGPKGMPFGPKGTNRGYIWAGKKEELQTAMKEAFIKGIKDFPNVVEGEL